MSASYRHVAAQILICTKLVDFFSEKKEILLIFLLLQKKSVYFVFLCLISCAKCKTLKQYLDSLKPLHCTTVH